MYRKQIALILCAAMAALLLSGCGKKYSDRSKDVEEVEDTENTLIYWSTYEKDDPQADVISDAVESFTKETGIKARVEFKGDIGIRDGLLSALKDKTRIDLMDGDMDNMNLLLKGKLTDLEELAAKGDYEKTAWPVLLKAARGAGGGKLYTIPFQPEVTVLYYNRQIFEEAGIKEEPVTWEEFLKVCEQIKKAGYTPLTSDDDYITSLMGYHLSRLLGVSGTKRVVDENDWSDKAVKTFAADYEKLVKKGYLSTHAAANHYPEGEKTEFAGGDVAMYLAVSSMPGEIRSIVDSKFTLGCFNYPELKGGKIGTEAAIITSKAFAVPKSAKLKKEAFQLIEWLTKGEWDRELATETGGIPADVENEEWPQELACVKPVFDNVTVRIGAAAGFENKDERTIENIKNCCQKLMAGNIGAKGFVRLLGQDGQ